jgi:hypothetical protein
MTKFQSIRTELLRLREEADKLPPELHAFGDETVRLLAQLWGYVSFGAMLDRIEDPE